jgi:hypothetical protein
MAHAATSHSHELANSSTVNRNVDIVRSTMEQKSALGGR